MADAIDKATEVFKKRRQQKQEETQTDLQQNREAQYKYRGRHIACIPPVGNNALDYYEHASSCMHSVVEDRKEEDEAGFCLDSTPNKIDDVLMLRMRDEWARRNVQQRREAGVTKPTQSRGQAKDSVQKNSFSRDSPACDPDPEKGLPTTSEASRSRIPPPVDSQRRSSQSSAPAEKKPGENAMRDEVLGLDLLRSHRRLRPVHPLARYLADAARLFESMATYRDEQVIHTYLFPEESTAIHLHPRRTLDQSNLWQLKTTRRRDRDQVVYRSTAVGEFAHRLSRKSWKPQENQEIPGSDNGGPSQGPSVTSSNDSTTWTECELCAELPKECCPEWERRDAWEWTGHTTRENKFTCPQCKDDITKVARLVMVDQVWLWILDEDTILACLPKRYGAARKDPSGVNYSIRKRMADQTNDSNHIRSVFDLGLIILDECFDTFFDRRVTRDRRPQVIDIFAESIGNVVGFPATQPVC